MGDRTFRPLWIAGIGGAMLWEAIVIATVYGGLPLVGGLWAFHGWRMRKRNSRGECAGCAAPLASFEPRDRFLIGGRLICPKCAQRSRRRIAQEVGVLGVLTAIATGVAATGADSPLTVLFPTAVATGMTLGAIHLMKVANRRAQRRIAAGKSPSIGTLEAKNRSLAVH